MAPATAYFDGGTWYSTLIHSPHPWSIEDPEFADGDWMFAPKLLDPQDWPGPAIPDHERVADLTESEPMEDVQPNDASTVPIPWTADVALNMQSEPLTMGTNRVQPDELDLIEASGATSNPTMCCNCGKVFSKHKSLKRHTDTTRCGKAKAFGSGTTGYQCPICPEYFSRKDILRRHVDTKHNSVKVECPKCGKSVSKRALPQHQRTTACKGRQSLQAMSRLEAANQIESSKTCAATFTSDAMLLPVFDSYRIFCRLFYPHGEIQAQEILLQHLSMRQPSVSEQKTFYEGNETYEASKRVGRQEVDAWDISRKRGPSCAVLAILFILNMLDRYGEQVTATRALYLSKLLSISAGINSLAIQRFAREKEVVDLDKARLVTESAFLAFSDTRDGRAYEGATSCGPRQEDLVDAVVVFFLGLIIDMVGLARGSEIDIRSEREAMRQEEEAELEIANSESSGEEKPI